MSGMNTFRSRIGFALVAMHSLAVACFGAGPGARMDYGPFLSYTVSPRPGLTNAAEHLAVKGLVLQVDGARAAVCFDTETLRLSGAWRGGFLDVSRSHLDSYKGSDGVFPAGPLDFQTSMGLGWANPDGKWEDPRKSSNGPVPRHWAHYHGLYRHGRRVVVAYRVGEREILETFGFDRGSGCFTRSLWIGPGSHSLEARLVSLEAGATERKSSNHRLSWREGERWKSVRMRGAVDGTSAGWIDGAHGALKIPSGREDRVVQVCLWPDYDISRSEGDDWVGMDPPPDPRKWTKGGPLIWPQVLSTRGKRGMEGGAYEVDTLTAPERNPWDSWLRFVAHDFFEDGRAALSTWNGDVWVLSGINDGLERLEWKRFAAGLFDALGLRVVEGKICVLGRDRITRLHDLNGDGEADFYENVNHDAAVTPSYHAFAMDLWTDRDGNFLYTRCGQRADPAFPGGGSLLRASRDGSKLEALATGLRAANGLGVGPEGQLTCSDNQGNWIPSGRLNWIEKGKFYGYLPSAAPDARSQPPEPPLSWIPQTMDNSGGSQVWVTSDRWGPLKGGLLHLSYGKAKLFLVPNESVGGTRQGGIIPFPLRFESGIMRARFHPQDGQLYVSGLKGWQTDGPRDAVFHRIRYTGKPWRLPVSVRTYSKGIELGFVEPLDGKTAADPQNFAVERWNYRWSADYGSKDYSLKTPGVVGRDRVEVTRVTLSPDRLNVRLELESMIEAMQLRVQFDLRFADGNEVRSEYCGTINRVGGE